MHRPVVYVCFLLAVYWLDRIVFYNASAITDAYKSFAEVIFNENSLYLRDNFVRSIYRFVLSSTTIFLFILALWLYSGKNLKEIARKIFAVSAVSLFLFLILFLHLNSRSTNSSALIYAMISYISMIALVLREQLVFATQAMFSKNSIHFYAISVIGLLLFIFSHKLVLTEGRVMATILMINLWIYTSKSMNIWHGVVVHASWNYAFPQSALFHYFILAYSFCLAFGQVFYPKILTSPMSKLMQNSFIGPCLNGWRQFWLTPARIHASLSSVLSRHRKNK